VAFTAEPQEPSTRPLPRQIRREANRQAIMNAVDALLDQIPYEDLRVEDVMGEAGLTRTAFYRYFPDLESVLLAWLDIIRVEFEEAANHWLALDVDPDAGILAATTGLAEVWSRHSKLLKAILDAATSGSRVQATWRQMVESFFAPVERRFADLARRGRLSVAHPEETARALVWMCERYLSETFTRDLNVPVETAGATLADIWTRVALGTKLRGEQLSPAKLVTARQATRHPG
jgi:AcrR family transcriptional regulator